MSQFLFNFFNTISILGGLTMMLTATTIVSLLVYFWKKETTLSKFILFNYLATMGIVFVLKEIVQKPRNPLALTMENTYAFPSGHTTVAVMTFLLLFYLATFVKSKFWQILMKVFGVVWMFLIISARLYLRVHDVYDIAGAIIVAVLVFYISTELKPFQKYRLRKDVKNIENLANVKKLEEPEK